MLVAAMLRPEQREDGELEVVRLALHEHPDAVELRVREAEGAVERLCGDRAQTPILAPGSMTADSPARVATMTGPAAMSRRHLAMLLGLAAIWGASFLFIKVGLRDYEPSTLVFFRVLLAALTLLPIAVVAGVLAPLGAAWKGLLVMGALNSAHPFWLLSSARRASTPASPR